MRIIQTNHQCARFLDNPINAPKIPFLGLKFSFSIHKFQTWKPSPKSFNYRYAGFQILDWNSNFQSSLIRTTDKLLQIFTHQDLFTMKKIKKKSIHKIYHIYYQFLLTKTPSMVTFIYDNLVFFYCCQSKNGQQLSQSSFFFLPFFHPHFATILHIVVISILI